MKVLCLQIASFLSNMSPIFVVFGFHYFIRRWTFLHSAPVSPLRAPFRACALFRKQRDGRAGFAEALAKECEARGWRFGGQKT